jgi:hypothetical protein
LPRFSYPMASVEAPLMPLPVTARWSLQSPFSMACRSMSSAGRRSETLAASRPRRWASRWTFSRRTRNDLPPSQQDFDSIAESLSEVVEAILSEERSRERRLQLVRVQIRRALGLGYRATKRTDDIGRDR